LLPSGDRTGPARNASAEIDGVGFCVGDSTLTPRAREDSKDVLDRVDALSAAVCADATVCEETGEYRLTDTCAPCCSCMLCSLVFCVFLVFDKNGRANSEITGDITSIDDLPSSEYVSSLSSSRSTVTSAISVKTSRPRRGVDAEVLLPSIPSLGDLSPSITPSPESVRRSGVLLEEVRRRLINSFAQ